MSTIHPSIQHIPAEVFIDEICVKWLDIPTIWMVRRLSPFYLKLSEEAMQIRLTQHDALDVYEASSDELQRDLEGQDKTTRKAAAKKIKVHRPPLLSITLALMNARGGGGGGGGFLFSFGNGGAAGNDAIEDKITIPLGVTSVNAKRRVLEFKSLAPFVSSAEAYNDEMAGMLISPSTRYNINRGVSAKAALGGGRNRRRRRQSLEKLIILQRRAHLSRMEWSLKMKVNPSFVLGTATSNLDGGGSGGFFDFENGYGDNNRQGYSTIIAQDTPIDLERPPSSTSPLPPIPSVSSSTTTSPSSPSKKDDSISTISTYEMKMSFKVKDLYTPSSTNAITNSPLTQSTEYRKLQIEIISFTCSYSYLFRLLDPASSTREMGAVEYGSFGGIHSLERQDHLLKEWKEATNISSARKEVEGPKPLEWKSEYWSFDLVLGWLATGDLEEARGVVEYLLEHESTRNAFNGRRGSRSGGGAGGSLSSSPSRKVSSQRYYRSEAISNSSST